MSMWPNTQTISSDVSQMIEEGKAEFRAAMERGEKSMHEIYEQGAREMEGVKEKMEAFAREIDWITALPMIVGAAIMWSMFMKKFHGNDYIVSSVHAIAVVVMAFVNLFYGLEEKWIFILMTGYFISDLLHFCLNPKYAIFIFHHILTVVSVYHMVTAAHLSIHSFASKAVLVEISTPFMNHYNVTKQALWGALFAFSFFAVRVVWLGYIASHGLTVSQRWGEVLLITSFSMLNLYWFVEIVRQARTAIFPANSESLEKSEESVKSEKSEKSEKSGNDDRLASRATEGEEDDEAEEEEEEEEGEAGAEASGEEKEGESEKEEESVLGGGETSSASKDREEKQKASRHERYHQRQRRRQGTSNSTSNSLISNEDGEEQESRKVRRKKGRGKKDTRGEEETEPARALDRALTEAEEFIKSYETEEKQREIEETFDFSGPYTASMRKRFDGFAGGISKRFSADQRQPQGEPQGEPQGSKD